MKARHQQHGGFFRRRVVTEDLPYLPPAVLRKIEVRYRCVKVYLNIAWWEYCHHCSVNMSVHPSQAGEIVVVCQWRISPEWHELSPEG